MASLSSTVRGLLQPSSLSAGGGSGTASKALPQFMETQTQTNWCWAANGASVGNFYWGAGTYTQCAIANTAMNTTTCCSDPAGCNQYGYLDKALQAAKSYNYMATGTTTYANIQSQINDDRPVGTRVEWNGGGAHFMMITGYDDDGDKINIQDPWYGSSTIAFNSYAGSYQAGGTWTHTYYTKKQ